MKKDKQFTTIIEKEKTIVFGFKHGLSMTLLATEI